MAIPVKLSGAMNSIAWISPSVIVRTSQKIAEYTITRVVSSLCCAIDPPPCFAPRSRPAPLNTALTPF